MESTYVQILVRSLAGIWVARLDGMSLTKGGFNPDRRTYLVTVAHA